MASEAIHWDKDNKPSVDNKLKSLSKTERLFLLLVGLLSLFNLIKAER